MFASAPRAHVLTIKGSAMATSMAAQGHGASHDSVAAEAAAVRQPTAKAEEQW